MPAVRYVIIMILGFIVLVIALFFFFRYFPAQRIAVSEAGCKSLALYYCSTSPAKPFIDEKDPDKGFAPYECKELLGEIIKNGDVDCSALKKVQ